MHSYVLLATNQRSAQNAKQGAQYKCNMCLYTFRYTAYVAVLPLVRTQNISND